MKRGKKGSHVGMMLSFGVFIVFLVFIFSVLQPIIKIEQDKKLILNDFVEGLKEKFDLSYTGGSLKTGASNFVGEMTNLANEYDSNYEGLKKELRISAGNEFGFIFVGEDGREIEPTTNVPESVNVYVKRIPIYHISEEKNVLLGFITLKIW